jgi:small subunit ribosomal protein S6
MTFIVRPDLDDEQTRAVVDQVTSRITGAGGEIIAALPWTPARRRMAYPIKDFGDGFYVTATFQFPPQSLRELQNQLKLNDRILRFLVVQATELQIRGAQQRLAHQTAAAAAPHVQTPAQATPVAAVTVPVAEVETITPDEAVVPADSASVSQPAAETTAEPGAEAEAAPRPRSRTASRAKSEPETATAPASETAPEPEANATASTRPRSRTASRAKSEPETATEADANTRPNSKTVPQAEEEPEPVASGASSTSTDRSEE